MFAKEISSSGCSKGQVINLIDDPVNNGVRVTIIKQNLTLGKEQDDIQSPTMVTMLSILAQLERVMIGRRTKEALAAKKRRVRSLTLVPIMV